MLRHAVLYVLLSDLRDAAQSPISAQIETALMLILCTGRWSHITMKGEG